MVGKEPWRVAEKLCACIVSMWQGIKKSKSSEEKPGQEGKA
jgi:hypothetical protein